MKLRLLVSACVLAVLASTNSIAQTAQFSGTIQDSYTFNATGETPGTFNGRQVSFSYDVGPGGELDSFGNLVGPKISIGGFGIFDQSSLVPAFFQATNAYQNQGYILESFDRGSYTIGSFVKVGGSGIGHARSFAELVAYLWNPGSDEYDEDGNFIGTPPSGAIVDFHYELVIGSTDNPFSPGNEVPFYFTNSLSGFSSVGTGFSGVITTAIFSGSAGGGTGGGGAGGGTGGDGAGGGTGGGGAGGGAAIVDLIGGTFELPVALPVGSVQSISGSISGGVAPESQWWLFQWGGGLFASTGTVTGANPLADFHFQLYDPLSMSIIGDVLLNNANGFTGSFSQQLSAGRYRIGLFTDSPFDPAFTIGFASPVAGVPEPANWIMMIAGFGLVGFAARRRRTALAA